MITIAARDEGRFDRYIGIDYSGAQTPTSSLKGLRVYAADAESMPAEVNPPLGLKKYWTRRSVAEWLVRQLSANGPAARRHRPWVLVSAGLLRAPRPAARLAVVPRRLPAPLAD